MDNVPEQLNKYWLTYAIPDFKGSNADFTPILTPLYYTTDWGEQKLPDRAAVTKMENGEYLGHVRSTKSLFKPELFFEFAREVIGDVDYHIVNRPPYTHQSLFMEVPMTTKGDDHYALVEFKNSFTDVPSAITVSPVRGACQNGLIFLDKPLQTIPLPTIPERRIRPIYQEKIEHIVAKLTDKTDVFVERLKAFKTGEALLTALLNACYPEEGVSESTLVLNVEFKRRIKEKLRADNLQDYIGTAYALYNAMTDLYQHDRFFVDPRDKLSDIEVLTKQALLFNNPAEPLRRVLSAIGFKR